MNSKPNYSEKILSVNEFRVKQKPKLNFQTKFPFYGTISRIWEA